MVYVSTADFEAACQDALDLSDSDLESMMSEMYVSEGDE